MRARSLALMQSLLKRSPKLGLPLALLYLLLGMAAAWHGPHDVHADAEISYQADVSSSTNSVVDADAFCALCSWQSLNQETAAATQATVASMPLVEATASSILSAPAPGFSQAHLARGPPSA